LYFILLLIYLFLKESRGINAPALKSLKITPIFNFTFIFNILIKKMNSGMEIGL